VQRTVSARHLLFSWASRAAIDLVQLSEKGEHLIWVVAAIVDRLRDMRGPGESYSDVILRFVEVEAEGTLNPSLTMLHHRSPSNVFQESGNGCFEVS
jgi:hypothetical protein